MARSLIFLLLGALAGAAVVLFVQSADSPQSLAERDIVDVPHMSLNEADDHRRGNFSDLATIKHILALPTRFMQTEALYAVTGRSNSATIQNHIFDANRIANDDLRISVLDILFFRLAELDVDSALALAGTDYFAGERHIQRQIWAAYGYKDLDAAIESARSQPSKARRYLAAQYLYAAFGHLNNPTIDRIEAELGIRPNQSRRAQYLYRLADKSPEAAIAYINSLPAGYERRDLVSWLAHYFSELDSDYAARFAGMLNDHGDRENYDATIASNVAKEDPRSVIDRLISSGKSGLDQSQIYYAFREIAKNDLEAAKQYYALLKSGDDKNRLGPLIVQQMLHNDVESALAWAIEHESHEYPMLQASVVRHIAENDPARALAIAESAGDINSRAMLMQSAVEVLAMQSPESAMQYIDQIDDAQLRTETVSRLISRMMRSDPDRAVDWIVTLDEDSASELFTNTGWQLTRSNVDAAIRLLPKVPKAQQQSWRYRIAMQLSESGNAEEAAAFIGRFDGQEGFASLQAAVIAGVATREPERAWQMAGQLADTAARDSAYVQIINHSAQADPVRTIGMLKSIVNDQQRATATGSAISQWAMRDLPAATRYASNLPDGPQRDMAIMALTSSWKDYGPAEQRLVASIQNDEFRSNAMRSVIFRMMRKDPARAREMLDSSSFTDMQRQQIESMLNRLGAGY